MDIISQEIAKQKGLVYYYTGKKCKNGHDSLRLVKGGGCRECKREYAEAYRNKNENKEKTKRYHKERHINTYTTEKRRKSYQKRIEKEMLYRAKKRALDRNISFDLTEEDILIPNICPVLGVALDKEVTNGKEFSPSLDRIRPDLGYVKGNVRVISNRANRLKSDASIEELERIIKYIKG